MFVEIGHFALILALALTLVQGVVPLIGAARRDAAWMAVGTTGAIGTFGFVAIAFACLTYAHVTSDFSVLNVVQHSHTDKPMLYKISGVWGNHEGSMVLWIFMLTLFGALIAWFGDTLPTTLKARTLAVQGLLGCGFLLFILLTSNPFERIIPAPENGQDLNPLLQDPGLAFHPPFLYFGYVGFSITFSFAVAALIEGRVDPAWARWLRPWTLVAWCGLTIGIAMGSWWAYYELGWGGWWFWDPVENASFMPWLLGTALLHSALVVEKRDALKSWTILLAILTFGLSLVGTFLVRSGVLTSVHAFAVDPARGIFILGYTGLAVGGALALYAWRAPRLKPGGLFTPLSREGALVFNNLFLSSAALTVFVGTLYPLFVDVMSGEKLSVGPPFFNSTFVPLMVPVVAAMIVGPMLPWRRVDKLAALGRLKIVALAALLAVAFAAYMQGGGPILALFGIALAAWAIVGSLVEFADRIKLGQIAMGVSWSRAKSLPRSSYGMTIAHLGIGITVAGIVAASAWRVERIEAMKPGDKLEIAGYSLAFEKVETSSRENFEAQRGVFAVTRNGDPVTRLFPERRWYPVARSQTTEAAIRTTGFSDLYLALGDPNPATNTWTVRAYYNPLVPWIWGGCIVMALGGFVSLTDRRYRLGLRSRASARTATQGAVPAE